MRRDRHETPVGYVTWTRAVLQPCRETLNSSDDQESHKQQARKAARAARNRRCGATTTALAASWTLQAGDSDWSRTGRKVRKKSALVHLHGPNDQRAAHLTPPTPTPGTPLGGLRPRALLQVGCNPGA